MTSSSTSVLSSMRTPIFDVTESAVRQERPPLPPTSFAEGEALKQENVRLQLALRELRHRTGNQWQFLIGLGELGRMQHPHIPEGSDSLRLRALLHAFMALNTRLDAEPAGNNTLAHNLPVRVGAALESILTLLQTTTEADGLTFAIEDVWLSERGYTALILICAELVCNAAKYGGRKTQVSVRAESGQGILEVRDDGPGFPADFCLQEQSGQGLHLVEALCRLDLRGELRCHNALQGDKRMPGAVITLTFPVLPATQTASTAEENNTICHMEGILCFEPLPE